MKLPLLVSVPHSGLAVPDELAGRARLSGDEIALDGDVGARAIYDFPNAVEEHLSATVARAFVDLNRPEADRTRDGVVKTHTCWNIPVYTKPLDAVADASLIEELLSRYHRPYHARLEALGSSGRFLMGVDCHTMAAEGPPVGPDPGERRPRICLGSGSGAFPQAWMTTLAECFGKRFGPDVTVDRPFGGGYITRRHGTEMPWFQLEMSRESFMANEEKRQRVIEALTEFVRKVAPRRS